MQEDIRNEKLTKIKENINKVIIGKSHLIDLILTAVIAGGHVLLEDIPGTGKTVMAKSLAKSLEVDFCRIQFTPDLLPSDITGINYYNQKEGEFVFRSGPVFCNVLLADEINRATPRTQSALLECMEEHQITVDGETRKLSEPFFVIATQNPVESSGTFPLPQAQLDRFLMQLSMGLPTQEEELLIMQRFLVDAPLETLESVCSHGDLLEFCEDYKEVYIHELLMDYIVKLVEATRTSPELLMGISPRGTLALLRAVRTYAMVKGRSYVVPEDIKELVIPVFSHRLIFPAGTNIRSREADTLLKNIMDRIEVPTEEWSR